jgi:Co/Zn/Cd efflux system component
MTSCCEKKACANEALAQRQTRILVVVLVINAVMFFVEMISGLVAESVSLTGDSLDMLGDAVAYGSSLYVVRRGADAKARSARLKGWIILGSALFVSASAIYRFFYVEIPDHEIMGGIGTLALAANLLCLFLLTRHKNDDVNMSAVWLCSRNDIISNTSVLAAAGLVFWTGTPWPDLVVGLALTVLFTKSALRVFADARANSFP